MRNKTFIKICLLSFLILVFSLASLSKEKTIESIWTESSLKIDGLDDEWAESSLNFEKKVKVNYAFKNNADDLYLLFVFNDPQYLSTIPQTGMTLWLNTEGKNKKKYGINFKMKQVTADELIAILEKQHGILPEADKKKLMSSPQYFLYQGDVIDKKGNILTASALGEELEAPVFRSKQEQKIMVHEFRMPLRILEKLSADQRMEPGKVVKVCFEWGGLSNEMKIARLKQRAESRPGGHEPTSLSSPSSSGEEGEVSSGRTPAEMQTQRIRSDPKKYSFWVDVKLAQL